MTSSDTHLTTESDFQKTLKGLGILYLDHPYILIEAGCLNFTVKYIRPHPVFTVESDVSKLLIDKAESVITFLKREIKHQKKCIVRVSMFSQDGKSSSTGLWTEIDNLKLEEIASDIRALIDVILHAYTFGEESSDNDSSDDDLDFSESEI